MQRELAFGTKKIHQILGLVVLYPERENLLWEKRGELNDNSRAIHCVPALTNHSGYCQLITV